MIDQNELASLKQELSDLEHINEQRMKVLTDIYSERNQLVAVLAKLFPATLEIDPALEETSFKWVCYIQFPTGQGSWHLHEDLLPFFNHVPRNQGTQYDGHTTEQKYDRLKDLIAIDHKAIKGTYHHMGSFNLPRKDEETIWFIESLDPSHNEQRLLSIIKRQDMANKALFKQINVLQNGDHWWAQPPRTGEDGKVLPGVLKSWGRIAHECTITALEASNILYYGKNNETK